MDAHFKAAGFLPHELVEVHGNVEEWQCSNPRACHSTHPALWPAPPSPFRFVVTEDMKAPRLVDMDPDDSVIPTGENWSPSQAFKHNRPVCSRGHLARPAVFMFEDHHWVPDELQQEREQVWRCALLTACRKRVANIEQAKNELKQRVIEVMQESISGCDACDELDTEELCDRCGHMYIQIQNQLENLQLNSDQLELSNNNVIQSEQASPLDLKQPNDQFESDSTPTPLAKDDTNQPIRVVVLEIGCGTTIPTCRRHAEEMIRNVLTAGGKPTLIRVNPDFPLCHVDDKQVRSCLIPIQAGGLQTLQEINSHMND